MSVSAITIPHSSVPLLGPNGMVNREWYRFFEALWKFPGTMGSQDADAVAITGGTINGTTIGATTPAAGTFSTLALSSGAIIPGTYTPTLTMVSNLDAVTELECLYMRLGDYAAVFGAASVDPTAAAPTMTELGISLPFASTFTSARDAAGVITSPSASQDVGGIVADTVNARVQADWFTNAATNHAMRFAFMYRIR